MMDHNANELQDALKKDGMDLNLTWEELST